MKVGRPRLRKRCSRDSSNSSGSPKKVRRSRKVVSSSDSESHSSAVPNPNPRGERNDDEKKQSTRSTKKVDVRDGEKENSGITEKGKRKPAPRKKDDTEENQVNQSRRRKLVRRPTACGDDRQDDVCKVAVPHDDSDSDSILIPISVKDPRSQDSKKLTPPTSVGSKEIDARVQEKGETGIIAGNEKTKDEEKIPVKVPINAIKSDLAMTSTAPKEKEKETKSKAKSKALVARSERKDHSIKQAAPKAKVEPKPALGAGSDNQQPRTFADILRSNRAWRNPAGPLILSKSVKRSGLSTSNATQLRPIVKDLGVKK